MAIIWQQGTRTVLKLTRCFHSLSFLDLSLTRRAAYLIHFSFRAFENMIISALIEKRPRSKDGLVMVSGQLGMGEVLQSLPYLTGSNQLADIKARPAIILGCNRLWALIV